MILEIQSRSHPYKVQTGASFSEALQSVNDGTPLFYLIDENLIRLYPQQLQTALASGKVIRLNAVEEEKSFERMAPLFEQLLQLQFKKNAKLVVIGGGITQDIGCFIATTLFRGIRWDLIPTTLLAQCDSCIGSKSSLNLGSYKNQIGTFYAPHQIFIPTEVIQTLKPMDIRSGIGEIIKIAWIAGGEEYPLRQQQLAQWAAEDHNASSPLLGEMISRSLRIKKDFIEQDEFDRGVRNLLNYAHTFGHAFESASHYKIPHGTAVLLGMLVATFYSENIGMCAVGDFERLREWTKPYYQEFTNDLTGCQIDEVLAAMKTDKKNTGDDINLILTEGPGKMKKHPQHLTREIAPMLKKCFEVLS